MIYKPDQDDETALTTLQKCVADAGSCARIGDKFYQLLVVPNPEADALVKPLLDLVAQQIREVRAQANAEVRREREKAQLVCPMPEVTQDDAARGLRIFKAGGRLYYVMPLHYAPKFLCEDDEAPAFELSKEHQTALTHDILMAIHIDGENNLSGVTLYQLNLTTKFSHYHGGGEDCLGTFRRNQIPKIDSGHAALEVRNHYQKTLESINLVHRRATHPTGLIAYEELERDAKPVTTGAKVWTTAKLPEPKEIKADIKTGGPIKVGSMVKVIDTYQDFPKEYVGVIGKAIHLVGDNVGVEFIFTDALNFHDCENKTQAHRGYYLPQTALQLMPPGTRRTKPGATPTQPTVARKPWTTRPAPIPDAAIPNPNNNPTVPEATLAQFKVGQTVRVLRAEDIKEGLVSKTAKVVNTSPIHIGVEFDYHMDGHDCNGTARKGYGWNFYHPEYLEIIEPAAQPAPKFKVGDRVQVIPGKKAYEYGFHAGPATIIKLDPGITVAYLDFGDGIYTYWGADQADIELLPPDRVNRGFAGKFIDPANKPGKPAAFNLDEICLLCGERLGAHSGGNDEAICPRDIEAYNREEAEAREEKRGGTNGH